MFTNDDDLSPVEEDRAFGYGTRTSASPQPSTPVDEGSNDSHFRDEYEAILASTEEVTPSAVLITEKGTPIQRALNDVLAFAQAPPTADYNPHATRDARMAVVRQQLAAILDSRAAPTAARDAVPSIALVEILPGDFSSDVVDKQLKAIEAKVLSAKGMSTWTCEKYLEQTLDAPRKLAAAEGRQWPEGKVKKLGEDRGKYRRCVDEYVRQHSLVVELVSFKLLCLIKDEVLYSPDDS